MYLKVHIFYHSVKTWWLQIPLVSLLLWNSCLMVVIKALWVFGQSEKASGDAQHSLPKILPAAQPSCEVSELQLKPPLSLQ